MSGHVIGAEREGEETNEPAGTGAVTIYPERVVVEVINKRVGSRKVAENLKVRQDRKHYRDNTRTALEAMVNSLSSENIKPKDIEVAFPQEIIARMVYRLAREYPFEKAERFFGRIMEMAHDGLLDNLGLPEDVGYSPVKVVKFYGHTSSGLKETALAKIDEARAEINEEKREEATKKGRENAAEKERRKAAEKGRRKTAPKTSQKREPQA